jgi:hypothetical protein
MGKGKDAPEKIQGFLFIEIPTCRLRKNRCHIVKHFIPAATKIPCSYGRVMKTIRAVHHRSSTNSESSGFSGRDRQPRFGRLGHGKKRPARLVYYDADVLQNWAKQKQLENGESFFEGISPKSCI